MNMLSTLVNRMLILITVLGVGISSCSKDHFNINKHPNQPTDSTVTYDIILPAALHNTGEMVVRDWGWLQNYMGYWARSGSYAPDLNEETYTITTNSETGIWNGFYNNNYDYEVMLQKAKVAHADFYEGIARIMKSHNYQILVDVYGNIPYREALKGNINITPAYDKGVEIYEDLFRQIDTGMALIRNAGTLQSVDIAENDIMFHGDKEMWMKFGNTLKLRMLIHLHNGMNGSQVVPGIDVNEEISIIQQEGSGFLMMGETAEVQPGYRSDKPNPFHRTYNSDENGDATFGSAYYRANKWGVDFYNYVGDPRIAAFYTTVNGNYRGVPYGLPASNENTGDKLSAIGSGLDKGADMPQWIITATESLFLQAEARHRGLISSGPSAKELWEMAIRENFMWLGDTDAHAIQFIEDYAGSGYPGLDFDADPMEGIILQKWFALNGVATFEVWTDYRRTDYVYGVSIGYDAGPPISVAPQNTATKVPSRLLYPQTEYNYNATNVGKEGTVDKYGKLFWDLN